MRPLDIRNGESLTNRLQQYSVKGASVAVRLPDGIICRITAGVSHDSVAVQPGMIFATGTITKNIHPSGIPAPVQQVATATLNPCEL